MMYVLNDKREPVPVTVEEYAAWDVGDARRVARTEVSKEVWVSTVFLGVDHNFFGEGPPILFETMVFKRGTPFDIEQACDRYATWAEAEAGHERWVLWARGEFWGGEGGSA